VGAATGDQSTGIRNACPYRAISFFHRRPRVVDCVEATTILTQGLPTLGAVFGFTPGGTGTLCTATIPLFHFLTSGRSSGTSTRLVDCRCASCLKSRSRTSLPADRNLELQQNLAKLPVAEGAAKGRRLAGAGGNWQLLQAFQRIRLLQPFAIRKNSGESRKRRAVFWPLTGQDIPTIQFNQRPCRAEGTGPQHNSKCRSVQVKCIERPLDIVRSLNRFVVVQDRLLGN